MCVCVWCVCVCVCTCLLCVCFGNTFCLWPAAVCTVGVWGLMAHPSQCVFACTLLCVASVTKMHPADMTAHRSTNHLFSSLCLSACEVAIVRRPLDMEVVMEMEKTEWTFINECTCSHYCTHAQTYRLVQY